MIIDRDYQIEAVLSVPRYFEKKAGNPVIAMPTGTGKSVVIARLCQYILQFPGQRIIIATHVKELIDQNYHKLLAVWPQAPAGIYSAGLGRKDLYHRITFAGIASIAKKAIDFGKIDILIIDEAHLVSPEEETNYRKFIRDLLAINPMLKVIGLTATPWRLGHGRIVDEGGLFTDVCFDLTTMDAFNWLIAEGYILPLVPKPTKLEYDLDGVGTRGGEFDLKKLQLAVDKEHLTRAALAEAMEFGKNRHCWLIFAAGIEHAIHCAEILTEMGIPCKAVHSKMPEAERDEAIKDWKSGKLWALANNSILTTGVDNPRLDFIVMLRHTKSVNLWVQMLGRGTRPIYTDGFDLTTTEGRLSAIAQSQKQNCMVMDFAGNVKRLGPINDPLIPRKKGEKAGTAPVKLCEKCNTWNHASLRHCFYCGAEFVFKVKVAATASTEQLIKSSAPITEVFTVEQVTYSKHEKSGGSQSIRVTYYCGLRKFMEFVPISSNPGLSRRWWSERVRAAGRAYDSFPVPPTVDAALQMIQNLPVATHIRVWINQQYPSIIATCFDGTKFGEQAAVQKSIEVKVETPEYVTPWVTKDPGDEAREKAKQEQLEARLRNKQKFGPAYDDLDDDIPF